MTHWKNPWCWERLRAKEKRASEDEMAGQHHQCDECELGQTLGGGEGQGFLGTLQSKGLQRVGRDWATEQQQRVVTVNQSIPHS